MKRFVVIAAIIIMVAAIDSTTTVQAGQAGRDNTRNVLIGGILLCQFMDCRQVVSNVFKGEYYDTYNGYSAGERSAYYRGRAEAEARIQAEREREAYERGCGGYCGGGYSYDNYRYNNNRYNNSGCYGDCGSYNYPYYYGRR